MEDEQEDENADCDDGISLGFIAVRRGYYDPDAIGDHKETNNTPFN